MKVKEISQTEGMISTLVNHPYFWLAIAMVSGMYLFMRYKYPQKVEWIELVLEMMWDMFLFMVTLQFLKENNGFWDKVFSFAFAGIILFTLYKVIMSFV